MSDEVAVDRREGGMTLVELLVSVVILAMITGALSASFITSINGQRPMAQRVKESNDAQLLSAYLVRDAQSAGGSDPATGSRNATIGVSAPGTAPDCTGPSGTVIVRFTWIERTSATTSRAHVANYFFDSSSHTIVRNTCVDGAAESQLKLAKAVGSVLPNGIAQCWTAPASPADCTTSASSPTLPQFVQLTLQATNNPTNAPTPYQYTVTASTRPQAQTTPNGNNSSSFPLLALGGCSTTPAIQAQGSPNIVVYGAAGVNNTCNPTSIGTAADFIATGGVDVGQTPFADPFANLAPPTVDCVNGTHTGTNGPGTYKSAASFGSGTLSPGVYIFCNGVTLSGNVTGNGVFFYVAGGTFDAGNANVTLSAMTTGAYGTGPGGAGLAIWQAMTDTNQMTVCCSNTASATIAGTVYAPGAIVQLKNADMRITQVVALSVLFGPGGGTHSTVIGTQPDTPVAMNTNSLAAWTVNRPYPNTTLSASGGSGGYTFSAGNLPAGLVINPLTGVISGTPTATGTFTVTLTVTDSIGEQDITTPTLLVSPNPTIATTSLPNWTVNRDYPGSQVSVTAGTGTSPFSWSATGLPTGLTIGASSGLVTGTPSATGTFTASVTITDAAGATVSGNFTITINAAPTITGPANLPNWTQGSAYPAQTMTRSNGTSPFTWSASGLPTGLSINASTGVISGTPTTAATYNATVTVTDNAGASASRAYTVKINASPGFGTTVLANGEETVPYSFTITPSGSGTPPYTWSMTGAPAWLSIGATTGTLTGTPPTGSAGTYASVKVTITDAASASSSKTYSLTIVPRVGIAAAPALSNWTINRDYPDTQLTGTNGVAPYSWSATGLPTGMTINTTTGKITGTPSATGTYNAVITITDSLGGTNTRNATIVINTVPSISTASLPDGERTVSYSATVAATSGTPGYTWSASGLPAGVAINASTGVISGTPTQAGPFTITVTATDVAGASASANFAITIRQAPSITTAGPLPTGTVSLVYSTTVAATNGLAPYTWSATGLPGGLSIDNTGTISGTPTAAGTFNAVNITVTDAVGASATVTYSMTVLASPTVTGPASMPNGTINSAYPATTITATGGTTPYTWSATGLPAGMSINASSGVISGTPTASGSFTAAVKVTDNLGAFGTASFTFTINSAPSITTSSLPNGEYSVAGYSATLAATGGTSPYTWSATGLPGGLVINAGTGVISGTPTAVGTFTVNAKVTDNTGAFATKALSLTVKIHVTTTTCTARRNNAVSFALGSTGGTAPLTWAGTPPTGVTLSSGGVLGGTAPSTTGTYPFTVSVTDTNGATGSTTFSLVVQSGAGGLTC